MDAHTIDVLAAHSPECGDLPNLPYAQMRGDKRFSPLHDEARGRFLSKYVQTSFGWNIAAQLANYGARFPIVLEGRDMWVYRAYWMMRDPVEYYNPHVAEAYHLAQAVNGHPNLRQHLKAMLLSFKSTATPDSHIKEVHIKTGVSESVLEAFEVLFFNVIDRRQDALYLAFDSYPNTRMVEFQEGYLDSTSYEDLLKRVAYNHRDIDLTAYMAGFGDHTHLRRIAASDDREAQLTRFLMGNGLLLAHSSLLNQRITGLNRVSNLLAASRQGGKEGEEPTLTGIVPLYSEAFQAAMNVNRDQVIEQLRKDGGFLEV